MPLAITVRTKINRYIIEQKEFNKFKLLKISAPADSQEITNFIRGYVDNQINLNSESSCWGTCSDYKFTRNYDCYNGTFCDEQRKIGEADPICRGTIFDCSFIEEKMEVCPSVSTDSVFSFFFLKILFTLR